MFNRRSLLAGLAAIIAGKDMPAQAQVIAKPTHDEAVKCIMLDHAYRCANPVLIDVAKLQAVPAHWLSNQRAAQAEPVSSLHRSTNRR